MVILIDNYDSFVFNLARYIAELGYDYRVFRNNEISVAKIQALSPSHIIISPGPGTPLEAGITLELIQTLMYQIPILGVCLGHQAIAQACGGRVIRATQPIHGKPENIFHEGEAIFQGLPSPFVGARYHSLMVSHDNFPACLQKIARTNQNEIMALRHSEASLFGVQFHPESILTEHGHALLSRFLHYSL